MKLKLFSILTVNCVLLLAALSARACGPFYPIIPTPSYFGNKYSKSMADYFKEENLRLWQQLTSDQIPLKDIEQAVYKDSYDTFYDNVGDYRTSRPSDNRFYAWLNNTGDVALIGFLGVAKRVEAKGNAHKSVWYYPRERDYSDAVQDFGDEIGCCDSNTDPRLGGRYALQKVRALFASRQYDRCIECYDSAFSGVPDTDLMKRMSMRYAAGCWRRLGDESKAAPMYAAAGDIWSLGQDTCVAYMMRHNPSAPQIMEYIRSNCADSSALAALVPLADGALNNGKVTDKGDWAYLIGYFYSEYAGDQKKASRYLRNAMQGRFSSVELRDLAHAYKLKTDARGGNPASLLPELQWMEGKCGDTDPDAYEWKRHIRNVLYCGWIPEMWRRKDRATAILLSSYADYLDPGSFEGDYGTLSFQLMESLTSGELTRVCASMRQEKPLYRFLRRYGRHDAEFQNELIGTLALREGNYDRAVQYLAKVSLPFQREMNIYKGGYLARDPFIPGCGAFIYTQKHNEWDGDYLSKDSDEEWAYNRSAGGTPRRESDNAKLDFARQMARYQREMKSGCTADERAWARLMYAVGRSNSFRRCWALTAYRDGFKGSVFFPALDYWDTAPCDDVYDCFYSFSDEDDRRLSDWYRKEVEGALASMRGIEMKAKAEYLFGNVKSVLKRYPSSSAAAHIKTSCDRWQMWL